MLFSRCADWEPARGNMHEWGLPDCIRILAANFDRTILDRALQAELADLSTAFDPLRQGLVCC